MNKQINNKCIAIIMNNNKSQKYRYDLINQVCINEPNIKMCIHKFQNMNTSNHENDKNATSIMQHLELNYCLCRPFTTL